MRVLFREVEESRRERYAATFFTTFRAKPKLALDEPANLSVDTQRRLERRKRTNLCAFVCACEKGRLDLGV